MHISAGILLAEWAGHRAAHVERAVEMHIDHVRPVRPAHLVEDDVAQNAGVVDQDVDAAEGVERGLDDQVGVLRLGDGERRCDCFAAGLLDGRDRSCAGLSSVPAPCRLAPMSQTTTRAPFGREHLGDGAADAAPGAGDDGDLAFDDTRH